MRFCFFTKNSFLLYIVCCLWNCWSLSCGEQVHGVPTAIFVLPLPSCRHHSPLSLSVLCPFLDGLSIRPFRQLSEKKSPSLLWLIFQKHRSKYVGQVILVKLCVDKWVCASEEEEDDFGLIPSIQKNNVFWVGACCILSSPPPSLLGLDFDESLYILLLCTSLLRHQTTTHLWVLLKRGVLMKLLSDPNKSPSLQPSNWNQIKFLGKVCIKVITTVSWVRTLTKCICPPL